MIGFMQIEHIHEKGSGQMNEDVLHVGKELFGVFDGATSLDRSLFQQGVTGGRIAAETACRVFAGNGSSLVELARTANREIYDEMVAHGVDCSRREQLWSTSAAVVRIKDDSLEWVQAGDSYVLFLYRDGSYRVPVRVPDHDYETLSMWKRVARQSQVNISCAVAHQIKKTRMEMNRSYGVLNGEPAGQRFLHRGTELLAPVEEILLFTDGLSIPSETPARTRCFDGLVACYRRLGLEGLKVHIREIEATDPQCRRFPRFKCHDDIAAISIRPATSCCASPTHSELELLPAI